MQSNQNYRIQFAEDNLAFRVVEIADPVPTGRQILTAAGVRRLEDCSLFAILATGDFEDIRLDETFDLRTRGAERFVAFRTDRAFKLTLDDRQIEWGKPVISGAALGKLARVGEHQAIFLEVRGGEDKLIEDQDMVDLAAPGIERFITAPRPSPGFEIIVNARVRIVPEAAVTFAQIVEIAFPGSHEPNAVFTMTFRHAASNPHAGELAAGGVVTAKKKGTIFNVTKTIQS